MRCGILVAGGTGERFGREGGKQLVVVAGEPLAAFAFRALATAETLESLVVVCHPERVSEYAAAVVSPEHAGRTAVVAGGATRRESVAAGLNALPADASIVAVHDAARPLIDALTLDRAVRALESDAMLDGVVAGHPAYDTMKQVDSCGAIVTTPDRASLWVAQTPQVFRVHVLRAAHARAAEEGLEATDDASLVEHIGGTVRMVEGPRWNIKVTVPEDLEVIEALLARRNGGA